MGSDNETDDLNKQRLKVLIRKRGQVKARLTRIKGFLESFDAEVQSLSNLTTRLQILDRCWSDFETIQLEIQEIDDDVNSDEEYSTFEDNYCDIRAKIEDLLTARTNTQTVTQPQLDTSDNMKLPDISLPIFSGKYEEWTDFHDIFEAMIHNSTKLTEIQKFYYLRSCLTDEALKMIKEIKISSNNYDSAWTLLKRRYKNNRLIIKAHVQGILNFKRLENSSAAGLRNLHDTITNHLTALKNLGEPVDNWSTLLVFVITKMLDSETRDHWEAYHAKHMINTRDEELPGANSIDYHPQPYSSNMLLNFIQEQSMIQEVREESRPQNRKLPVRDSPNNSRFVPFINKTACHTVSASKRQCGICNEDHATYACKELSNLSSSQRHSKVRKLKLCLNCLRSGHKTIQCKSPHCCKHCNKRHHSSIHIENFHSFTKHDPKPDKSKPSDTANITVSACSNYNEEVILATAIILTTDSQGITYPCRALLDSGSQSNFISQSLASSLGLKHIKLHTSVTGIGNMGVSANFGVHTTIKSNFENYEENLDFLVLSKITNDLPNSSITTELKIPKDIRLADDRFFQSRSVDILLGASVFYNILKEGHIKLGDNLPILQNTVFGWIVSGKVSSCQSTHRTHSALTVKHNTSEDRLEDLITAFWEIEDTCKHHTKTYEEQACDRHYTSNVKRQTDGRFIVKLPFANDPTVALGKSKVYAIQRFMSLERKLSRDTKLKEDYTAVLNEYLENDEMELISEKEEPKNVYYLPHHPVIKESSTTTRVRVVFDASAKTSNNNSLNDILMVGPTIQRNLASILLSFRLHVYVFVADIKQMYRKVLLDTNQQDFQRILWRDNPNDPLKTYRLKTITYGTASAPFLAIKTLFHLAEEERANFPDAAEVVQRDFYVDDVLTGSDSLEKVIDLQLQLIALLKGGGFELRKWCANHPSILKNIASEHIETDFPVEESGNKTIKTLGMYWQPSNDTFQFKVNLFIPPNIITKRVILSDISRIFDPIGLISPIVITAKLFMQEIWLIKGLGWDHPVPEAILTRWTHYQASLKALNQLTVPRRVLSGGSKHKYEVHGFSDASERAYGACIYIRTIQENGTITVNLLCSKSRVAPLKLISLPRLELCGALLLSQLLQNSCSVLENLDISRTILWTDSTIVLHWLNSPPNTWQTFVGNRVSQIHELTQNCIWMHVRSQENPADLISRSVPSDLLINQKLWWYGPHWLSEDCSNWPKVLQTTPINLEIEERRKKITVHSATTPCFNLADKFSSWTKLLRITALCQRFIDNCKQANCKRTGHLTPEDLQNAEVVWIKYAQHTFSEDILKLQKNKEVNNQIKSLSPFVDENGILRVGGRLKNAAISPDYKHQILLPSDHRITQMIVAEAHINTLHAGPQALLATIRTKYWPIKGKILARSTVKECVKCSRTNPRAAKHLMGDLPSYRVQPSHPFENCGIDYCGPFYYRRVLQRRSQPVKAYVALFICMATKAIHLELVPDLTTRKFLEALQRMIARRGAVKNIYSDNATNFIGAKNELHELQSMFASEMHQHQLHKLCASLRITWHFIPPHAPHFGGLWEAGVKSVKTHLKRVLGTYILAYDELETLFVKIEACVNSRPITELSNDPNDLNPLTPAHFLIGQALTSFPVSDVTTKNSNRLDHWQRIQQMYQNFWRRWSTEYLSTLQHRTKWTKDYKPPPPGSLVLIKEDFRPPLHWDLGRIVQLHNGADGRPRVATVWTTKGLMKRPLVKLCILPHS